MFDLRRQFGEADGMAFKVTIRPIRDVLRCPLSDAQLSQTKPPASWHHNRTRIKIKMKDRVRHYQIRELGDGHDSWN
jgi:hypothetical protein